MLSFSEQREQMVKHQIISRGVKDDRVLAAMRLVPRERFVPENSLEFAYDDTPLPIEEGQTISQPYIVAVMIEALELSPNDRVLEIGAGSGYAAAVLSRIAKEVIAIERHKTLADLAHKRANELGYDNLQIIHSNGTLGWPELAPYDAIIVSAGGPEVPQSLLEQLPIGGRLVIPVGDELRTQELLRVRRIDWHEYEEDSLGRVQFVPLIGTEGWSLDGMPVAPRRARQPLRVVPPERELISTLIKENCEPFDDIDSADISPLLDRIGESNVVLIGEATHGTSEFYKMRARITRDLITQKAFNIVAIEGDWPDVRMFDNYVRGRPVDMLGDPAFSRFPTWMWRNKEVQEFIDWLREHNSHISDSNQQVGMHGLDLYSLNNSIKRVLDFLDRVDSTAAQSARVRYGCFSPWETDPTTYGRAAVSGEMKQCEEEVVAVLTDLLFKRMEYVRADGEAFFDAERNAAVIREAERYYRTMYYGSRESWNLRDRHMFDTLNAIMQYQGADAKAVVWAHNSHVGNAAATEMGTRGEFNIGQLAREKFGSGAWNIGFGTHCGSVAAASNWGDPVQIKRVRPSHEDSYERLCHDAGIPAFLLHLRHPDRMELREELMKSHLERAIGVIYRPESEMVSHYFQAVLPAQFDEYIWLDETTAVQPLEVHALAGVPETYPFGL